MGLGAAHTVSLAEARAKGLECRKLLLDGIDPIEQRNGLRAQTAIDAAKSLTFDQCAAACIEAHRAGWRSAKHVAQWTNTLATYAGPVFGNIPVQSVDLALVLKAIEPIWRDRPETGSRLRGRIEAVLDWARVRGYRSGDNPARWRGHLDSLLPARARTRVVRHHVALPYGEIGAFMAQLREQEGIAALALEFTILTAARTGEVVGARAGEITVGGMLWTVPAERMKAGKEHRCPLSPRAVKIISALQTVATSEFVFPGRRPDKPMSGMTMLALLKRMGRTDLTVHGFRSTFRDWCAEQTNYPREVAEAALAHNIGDTTEAAYFRADFLAKRRQLMTDWARFCQQPAQAQSKKVVPIGRGRKE